MSYPPPLQTHGIVVEKWIPPRTRFITYEPKDEELCRYCGIGEVVQSLAELYDVRDERNELIGYTRHNPADVNQMHNYLNVAIRTPCRLDFLDSKIVRPERSYEIVEIQQRIIGYRQSSFLCWYVRSVDAVKLVRSKWIECIGEDNIDEFCFQLERKYYEREGQLRYRSC